MKQKKVENGAAKILGALLAADSTLGERFPEVATFVAANKALELALSEFDAQISQPTVMVAPSEFTTRVAEKMAEFGAKAQALNAAHEAYKVAKAAAYKALGIEETSEEPEPKKPEFPECAACHKRHDGAFTAEDLEELMGGSMDDVLGSLKNLNPMPHFDYGHWFGSLQKIPTEPPAAAAVLRNPGPSAVRFEREMLEGMPGVPGLTIIDVSPRRPRTILLNDFFRESSAPMDLTELMRRIMDGLERTGHSSVEPPPAGDKIQPIGGTAKKGDDGVSGE